jgi:hypothetical protein
LTEEIIPNVFMASQGPETVEIVSRGKNRLEPRAPGRQRRHAIIIPQTVVNLIHRIFLP